MGQDRELYLHCQKALQCAHEMQPISTELEAEKEWIRRYSEKTGQGGGVEVPGLGAVEFKAGCEARLKGILPVLAVDAFLDLSEGRRKKLMEEGVVVEEKQWQPARKPSVTVRL